MRVDEPKSFRDNLIKNLNKIIKNEKLATNIEKGIFNYTIKQLVNHEILLENGITNILFRFIWIDLKVFI